MIINGVDYSDKLVRRWKQLSANLEFALKRDWIPVIIDLKVEPELIEAGHPHFERKEVGCVECPTCGEQYKFGSVYYIARHKNMGCKGEDS